MGERDGRRSRSGPDGISWPEPGSGFEADQYSPAGEIDRLGALAQAARAPGVWKRAAQFNIATKLMVLMFVLLAVAIVAALVATAISALLS